MQLTKQQQETLKDLERLLAERGRAWLLGWALGQLLLISKHDYELQRRIRRLSSQDH